MFGSADYNFFLPLPTAWDMVGMTRRKLWELLRALSMVRNTSRPPSLRATGDIFTGACRYTGKHHPYDYRSDCRSGGHDAVVRSSLGHSSTNCLGLDSYHSGFCNRGGSRILGVSSS